MSIYRGSRDSLQITKRTYKSSVVILERDQRWRARHRIPRGVLHVKPGIYDIISTAVIATM